MKKLIPLSCLVALGLSSSACTQTFVGEPVANPTSGEVWYLKYTQKQFIGPPTVVSQEVYYCKPNTAPGPQQCARADMSGAAMKKK